MYTKIITILIFISILLPIACDDFFSPTVEVIIQSYPNNTQELQTQYQNNNKESKTETKIIKQQENEKDANKNFIEDMNLKNTSDENTSEF